jgi:hypothetical protein
MKRCPTLHKFPEGSTHRDYDIFEELPDGKKVWRACVIGMENIELKLRDLARESNNKFLALHGEISAIDNFRGGGRNVRREVRLRTHPGL